MNQKGAPPLLNGWGGAILYVGLILLFLFAVSGLQALGIINLAKDISPSDNLGSQCQTDSACPDSKCCGSFHQTPDGVFGYCSSRFCEPLNRP